MVKAIARDKFDPHETTWSDALAGRPLASFSRRLAAYLLDFFFASISFAPLYIGGTYLNNLREGHPDQNIVVTIDFHNLWSLVWLVTYFGLSVWHWNGSTLGKQIVGIRIFSLIGPHITLWQALERALGYGASTLEAGFGFLQFFFQPNHRCLHDRIADTVVLFVRHRSSPASPPPPKFGSELDHADVELNVPAPSEHSLPQEPS